MGKFTPKKTGADHFMWMSFVSESDMPSASKHLVLYLGTYMNTKTRRAYPSLETIVKGTSLSRATVCRHLKKLEAAGWITRTSGGYQKGTVYTMQIPDELTDSGSHHETIESHHETIGGSHHETIESHHETDGSQIDPTTVSPRDPNNKELNNKDLKIFTPPTPPRGGSPEKPKPKRKAKTHAAMPDVVPDGLNTDALELWLQYKAERREWYQPIGLKSLITQMSKRELSEQMEQVERASSNGWKGIQWPREQRQANHETMTDLDRRVIERIMNTPPAKPKKRKLSIY